MEKLDQYHRAEQIAPHTWRIDEAGIANCYLLEGDKAALLVDTACGAGDLRACVAGLTDKPVLVAVTHRHPDHVGGAWRFGSYYASPADCAAVYTMMCLPFVSRAMVARAGYGTDVCARPKNAVVRAMEDGQSFDLGGRDVSILAVPGHTRGSVAFLDRKEKLIFTGDEINSDLWMHLPGCTSLETWCRGADRILTAMKQGYDAWNGHWNGRLPLEQAIKMEDLVRTLIIKKDKGEIQKRWGSFSSPDGKLVIRYRF